MTRTITAIYDSKDDAEFAREQLLDNGIEDTDVRIVSHQLERSDVGDDKSVWESLKDFFIGEEDRPIYSEGPRRGGYLLTARVNDERSTEAIGVLEETNAVDLDRRTQDWRNDGWIDTSVPPSSLSGFAAGAGPTTETVEQQLRASQPDGEVTPAADEPAELGSRSSRPIRVRTYIVQESVRIRPLE